MDYSFASSINHLKLNKNPSQYKTSMWTLNPVLSSYINNLETSANPTQKDEFDLNKPIRLSIDKNVYSRQNVEEKYIKEEDSEKTINNYRYKNYEEVVSRNDSSSLLKKKTILETQLEKQQTVKMFL